MIAEIPYQAEAAYLDPDDAPIWPDDDDWREDES